MPDISTCHKLRAFAVVLPYTAPALWKAGNVLLSSLPKNVLTVKFAVVQTAIPTHHDETRETDLILYGRKNVHLVLYCQYEHSWPTLQVNSLFPFLVEASRVQVMALQNFVDEVRPDPREIARHNNLTVLWMQGRTKNLARGKSTARRRGEPFFHSLDLELDWDETDETGEWYQDDALDWPQGDTLDWLDSADAAL